MMTNLLEYNLEQDCFCDSHTWNLSVTIVRFTVGLGFTVGRGYL
jgi:hypothetical protein